MYVLIDELLHHLHDEHHLHSFIHLLIFDHPIKNFNEDITMLLYIIIDKIRLSEVPSVK